MDGRGPAPFGGGGYCPGGGACMYDCGAENVLRVQCLKFESMYVRGI